MSQKNDQANAFIDQLIMPATWHVFLAGSRHLPLPDPTLLAKLPKQLIIGDQTIPPLAITHVRCQHDLCKQLGQPPAAMEQTTYIYLQLNAQQEQQTTIGFGWDHWLMGWFNGQPLFDGKELSSNLSPPSIRDMNVNLKLELGINTLVFRVTGGTGPCMVAIGGPAELDNSDERSLLDQPLLSDPRWAEPSLTAKASQARGQLKPIDIASRRELFVDDYLIDSLTGTASQRLHQPQPREVVLTMNKSWESNFTGNFMPVVAMQEPGKIRLYYYAANWDDQGLNLGPVDQLEYAKAKKYPQYAPATCFVESADGIHFERPNLGLIEHKGSKDNNMFWNQNQYLTPFIDTNPDAPADAKYKALSRHPSDGLGAYASADGIHWRHYHDKPIITEGKFDSQNLAFWDSQRNCYVEYHRGQPDTPLTRGIMTSTSTDFIHWTKPTQITFTDTRDEQMYTNCIAPYPRAPHLYMGTPARFITYRYKDQNHKERGISDSVLMTSRDGKTFDRWEEAFLRPDLDPESWTDRNSYLAWGMPQTGEHELSVYWCEHNGHPGLRIRRGTLRLDGFASIHATGKGPGELLTKTFTFNGSKLEINFATSAAGTMLFELCDEHGQAIPGYALADSEVLYGNEIAHTVRWPGQKKDLRHLAGKPVRLRVRMHDADLYAMRFVD